ncbi:hypothetical protein FF905_02010 [Bordetella pertussis]|nr:hypothetical protein FF912_02015 [Bordetella pertussis]QKC13272.1 hypothetical protein FF905_02010 [Bordetella pertussis]QKC16872.1 hypothetical protein FF904_02010 [Bordetella pertussis]QKC20483.1 hypothetical protein FF903_02010 [Bordetella pertussis]QKC24156.1 hypothetical protein FF902_02015 [Bordetella pertussis]
MSSHVHDCRRTVSRQRPATCEDSIGCMHGSSEPDLRNWKSPIPQFTQGARPDEHP